MCALAALLAIAGCGAPAPTPTRTPLPSENQATAVFGTRAAVQTQPGAPFVTATLLATEVPTGTPTWTGTPEPTATVTASATLTATAASATVRPPAPPANPSPAPGSVWTMAPLMNVFTALGPYPPESPLPRSGNIDPLSGLPVANPAVLQRRPVVARIMNDPSARPQTGLNEAELVFEELIDQKNGVYALTRLTAVYLANESTIRPFRSARLINASLAPMFDGALAHSGASDGTRFLLSKMPIVNLDQFFAEPAYCGVDRIVNGKQTLTWVTSTVARMHEYMQSKGLEKPVPLRGFVFAETAPPGQPISSIVFERAPWPVSAALAGRVEWRYQTEQGRYFRFVNDAPHNTIQYTIAGQWGKDCQITSNIASAQVNAANVVVLYARHEATDIVEDANNFTNIYIVLTGEGRAQVLRDGVMVEGRWRRPTLQHFFEFVDQAGAVIPLKPGNTWFQIVPTGYLPTLK